MSNSISGFISRITLRPNITLAQLRHFRLLNVNEYAIHQLLWDIMSYSPTQKRDFLFRCDYDRDGFPDFTVVSKFEPRDDQGIWNIRTREYSPHLQAGDELLFSLTCNPVKTLFEKNRKELGHGQKRVDVILEAKRKAKESEGAVSPKEILQTESLRWIEDRSERNGFQLDKSSLVVGRYVVNEHPKDANKTLSILGLSGQLRVSNPHVFQNILFEGIGHAKAWGCGLLLVKRM